MLKIGISDNVNVISDSDSDPYYFSELKFQYFIVTNVPVVYMALITVLRHATGTLIVIMVSFRT